MDLCLDDVDVTLREPIEAHARGIAAAAHASLTELSPWMPWATPGYDEAMASRWVAGEFDAGHRFVLVESDGSIIGTCALNRIDEQNRSANLGYWIRTDATGRGIASSATRALARYGIEEVGLRRIEVKMSTRNHASRRVAEKAGAVFEGTLRHGLLLGGEFHDAHLLSFVAGDL